MYQRDVNEPEGNQDDLLANKLERQKQFRSEAIDVDDHPALNILQKKILEPKRSADDLILMRSSGLFKFGLDDLDSLR